MSDDWVWEESGTPGVFFVFGRPRRFLGHGVKGCSRLFSTVADALAWLANPDDDQDHDRAAAPDLPDPNRPKPTTRGRSR